MREKASPRCCAPARPWCDGGASLIYKAPFILRIDPAATATSYGVFYPGGSSEKIFGKHILEAARLGQKAA